MSKLISEKELKELRDIEGKIRGVALKGDSGFVEKKRGKEAVKRLEEEMKKAGHPISYKKLNSMEFYPLSLDAVNLVVMKRLFDFSDEEMVELGAFLSKSSLVLRLFMTYFVSLEKALEKAPLMWKKNYTVGKLEVAGVDKEEKELVVRVHDFEINELYCLIFKGYFSSVLEMVLEKKARAKESKCVHRGDPYHEFVLSW